MHQLYLYSVVIQMNSTFLFVFWNVSTHLVMIIYEECVMAQDPSGRYFVENRALWRALNFVGRYDNLLSKTRFLCSVCDFGEILKCRQKTNCLFFYTHKKINIQAVNARLNCARFHGAPDIS